MAKENENMPANTSRNRLVERYKKNRPELDWNTEGANDIDALAADELDSFDKDREARSAMDEKMNGLFGSDSRAAKIFVGWANGQDPIENLLELYGDDFVEALQSPEGKDKFKLALEKWRKGKEADSEHQKVYDSNIQNTAGTLVAFADKNNLSDEQVKEIVNKCHEFGSNVLNGLYTEDMLEMVYKAGNYDQAVADAMEEGRVNGKNENIRRELRQSKPATGLPPTVGSQDAVASEAAPAKPTTGKLDVFGGIPIKKK